MDERDQQQNADETPEARSWRELDAGDAPSDAPSDAPTGELAAGGAAAQHVSAAVILARRVREAAGACLVGMDEEIDFALAALLAGGHVLLEGPPGVAKTLFVRTLAQALGASFARIQFTPDLMPADVTGTSIFHPGQGEFRFRPGPIFARFVLCDEINRAPAKTQSALLEAMQEGSVTIDGEVHPLPDDFSVFATMNPIEHEGTYPLPEAQLDRFLFKIEVSYPTPELEARLLSQAHRRSPSAGPAELGVTTVVSDDDFRQAQACVENVQVREDLPGYLVRLFEETRQSPSLVLGASPRAGVMLLRGAKAHAALDGRDYVTPDDIKRIFLPALRHRVALDPAEEIEGVTSDDVLARILDRVEVPR